MDQINNTIGSIYKPEGNTLSGFSFMRGTISIITNVYFEKIVG